MLVLMCRKQKKSLGLALIQLKTLVLTVLGPLCRAEGLVKTHLDLRFSIEKEGRRLIRVVP